MSKNRATNDKIAILVPDTSDDMRGVTDRLVRTVEIDTAELGKNIKSFVEQMGRVMSDLPASAGQYDLSQIELSVELTASGEVVICGIGGGASVTGGVTFVFLRKSALN